MFISYVIIYLERNPALIPVTLKGINCGNFTYNLKGAYS